MITLPEIIARFNYQITDSSKFQWQVYGPNARYMDFKHSSIVFDTENQTIYEISCSPDTYGGHTESLFWIDTKYEVAYNAEVKSRNLDKKNMGNQIYSCEAMLRLCDAAESESFIDTDLFNIISVDFSEDLDLYYALCEMAEKKMISPERMLEQIVTDYCSDLPKIKVNTASSHSPSTEEEYEATGEIDLSEKKPKKNKKNKSR